MSFKDHFIWLVEDIVSFTFTLDHFGVRQILLSVLSLQRPENLKSSDSLKAECTKDPECCSESHIAEAPSLEERKEMQAWERWVCFINQLA